MLRWGKMRSILGFHWWFVFILLLFLLMFLIQLFENQSLEESKCHSPQPRRELQTVEETQRYDSWKQEQVKRKKRVKDFCEKETKWKKTWLSDPNIHPLMFQYNEERSLMGCLQPKVFKEDENEKNLVRWHQQHGISISIVWSPKQSRKSFNSCRGKNKRICCRYLCNQTLQLSPRLPSLFRWSDTLLRGWSLPTRIRWGGLTLFKTLKPSTDCK